MLHKMKLLLTYGSFLLLAASCGLGSKDNFDESRKLGKTTRESDGKTVETLREELKVADKAADAYKKGLFLTIKNSLSTHEPKLSVELCSALENDSEFCLINKKVIKYDESVNYYISENDLKKLMDKDNKIRWNFNETYSNSIIHWHCHENSGMKVDSNKLNKAEVKVTQINNLSYSCVLVSSSN